MPELPEVETIANDLRPALIGRQISGVHVLWPRTVAEPEPAMLELLLPGQHIRDVKRRGKYLLLELEHGCTLIVHLRMTGRLELVPAGSPVLAGPHVRAWFDLADGGHLVFTDARRFGRLWLVNDPASVLASLGPEPLDPAFTPGVLADQVRGRRAAIKTLLLDQTVIAGLGNIYADEALFLAGIHPLRPAGSLSDEEIEGLHGAIRQVLNEAIGHRGTTLRDYRPPNGLPGAHQDHLRVYHRTGQPCLRCGTPIQRVRVGQRSTHFCPHCQLAARK
jgi:formamidopyrimidine-DNA glycosylase